jgi:hypothetical protein
MQFRLPLHFGATSRRDRSAFTLSRHDKQAHHEGSKDILPEVQVGSAVLCSLDV